MSFRHLIPRTPVKQFTQYDCEFAEYIEKMKKVISNGRFDITGENAKEIIDANCPYEWRPEQPNGNGVLLVHGQSDSPFFMRDLATHFVNQGYLVRSVLLPGHGTIPGDILHVKISDWIDCVSYGITQTAPHVDKLFLCGFSMGSLLSILCHDHADNIAAFIGIAPGFKLRHRFSFVARIHKLFTWISDRMQWYFVREQLNHVKYFAHPFHAAQLAIKVMDTAVKVSLKIPTFMSLSSDDETIKPQSTLDFFMRQKNPLNRFIYYTNDVFSCDDPRVEIRPSSKPTDNIVDFSHVCIPISPDNPYLGRNGEFVDFSHYKENTDNHKKKKNVKLGAISARNITHHTMQRLYYNPDFEYLTNAIDEFMNSI